jgi:hypothetical protein
MKETAMNESELLMLQTEIVGNVWSILFTWIGTTTAMVGAAYFVAASIKLSTKGGFIYDKLKARNVQIRATRFTQPPALFGL